MELSKKVLRKPIVVNGTSEKAIPVSIQQKVILVEEMEKMDKLLSIFRKNDFKKVLVFTPTIFMAKEITRFLKTNNHPAAEIHSDKSQNTRQNTLSDFRNSKIKILVGTDILARGIDVDDIDLVLNFNIPNKPETFIHRIGRTGRAGKTGLAISLCSEKEIPYLKAAELLLGEKIELAG
jgi:ATP-dependent RNA helicase RhlE